MNKICAAIVLIFMSTYSFGKIVVVSDLDETIKHTTCAEPSKLETLRRAIFSSKVYSAMPTLHRMLDRYVERQYILTGSPTVVKPFVWRLIRKNNIPIDGVYTNSYLPFRNTYRHKVIKLHMLFRSFPDHQFILIGDNTNKDAQIYETMAKIFPGKVLAIYIHRVHSMPDDYKYSKLSNYFYSAYEIAYAEYRAGRMALQDVEQVYAQLFNDEKKLEQLFPRKVYCPKKTTYFDHMTDEGLRQFTETMREKIINFCKTKTT